MKKTSKKAPAAKTTEEKSPIIIPEGDRLRLENAQLRHMSVVRALQSNKLQENNLRAEERRCINVYNELLVTLKDKYGFDPATSEMDADTGLVRPRQPAGVPAPTP